MTTRMAKLAAQRLCVVWLLLVSAAQATDYYLDATPTHSWGQLLYRYPQAASPYGERGEHPYSSGK